MWDTAGQEKFKTITSAYYKGAQGIIVVFDVTDRNSFQNVHKWLAECEQFGNLEPVKVLVGNKTDMGHQRQVSSDEAKAFAENLGMVYLETSAKSNQNVEKIFHSITTEMREKFVTRSRPITPEPQHNKKRILKPKNIQK